MVVTLKLKSRMNLCRHSLLPMILDTTNSYTYDMFNYEINTFLKAAKKFLLNTPNIENVNLG